MAAIESGSVHIVERGRRSGFEVTVKKIIEDTGLFSL